MNGIATIHTADSSEYEFNGMTKPSLLNVIGNVTTTTKQQNRPAKRERESMRERRREKERERGRESVREKERENRRRIQKNHLSRARSSHAIY